MYSVVYVRFIFMYSICTDDDTCVLTNKCVYVCIVYVCIVYVRLIICMRLCSA